MSTRGAIGFRINGVDKITYNHSDSYPSGLGVKMFDFINSTVLDEIISIAKRIVLVDSAKKVTSAQLNHINKIERETGEKIINLTVGERSEAEWYCVLRNVQGELEVYKKSNLKYMVDNAGFLHDSLFCEWAYIINCDEKTLEVYTSNKCPAASGRYAEVEEELGDGDYAGVRLLVALPFAVVKSVSNEDLLSCIELFRAKTLN